MTAALDDAPPATHPGTRHLLSSEDLDRASVDRLLELAASFEAVAEREVKKLPTLRGRTVLSVFFEASTRTASSSPRWTRTRSERDVGRFLPTTSARIGSSRCPRSQSTARRTRAGRP